MVNKREKTRSLVYQMKEDIFQQEVALAELEDVESSGEQESEAGIIPLPKYCHHSTGTVYDCPDDILRMARLIEERGQMLDRKNLLMSLPKASSPLRSNSRLVADVSPTRSRRNRQNTRPSQANNDGLGSSPAMSRSPIQQLFRDKMEGLESGVWAAGALEVKTDSTNDDLSETSHEASVTPAVSSEKLNVPDLFSPTVTSTANGLVKALQAIANQKVSDSKPMDRVSRKDKSVSGEQMPLTDVVQIGENAVRPAVTVATDLHVKPEFDNIIKADQDSDELHASKTYQSEQSDRVKVERAYAENVESVKAKSVKSSRRSGPKKSLEPAKTGQETESQSSKTDSDTVARIRTRRRISREQLDTENDVHKPASAPLADVIQKNENTVLPTAATEQPITAELDSSQSQKCRLSRSAGKVRSSEQLNDVSDLLTRQPAVAKSVRRKRFGTSDKESPDNEKSRVKDQFITRDASDSVIVLPKDLLADEEHRETASNRQKAPLQDSLALNRDTVIESVTQQMSKSSPEASDITYLTSRLPLNLETLSSMDISRVDFSGTDSDQNQYVTGLQSVDSYTTDSKQSFTLEAKHADDATGVKDTYTQLINPENTCQLRHVNSPKHQESGNLLDGDRDALLSQTPVAKSETVKKRSLSVSKSRTKARPSVCKVDTAVERYEDTTDSKQSFTLEAKHADDATGVKDTYTQLINPENTRQLRHVNSPKHQESGNLLDGDRDALLSQTPVAKSETVKKRSLSVSKSRTKARPSVCKVDTAVERYEDTEKGKIEDRLWKKLVSQRRRRISKVDMGDENVSESHVMLQTDGDASGDKHALTVGSKEDTASCVSTKKEVTERSVSISSHSRPSSKTADSRVELTSSLLAERLDASTSLFPVANEGSKLVTGSTTDADNLQTRLESQVNDGFRSPGNLAHKLDFGVSDLYSPRTVFQKDNKNILPVEAGWRPEASNVGMPLSELAKTSSSAISRKRAAHLMAGCRHRTVGVKKPSLTAISDQPMEVDANSDRPPVSERVPFTQPDLDIYRSPYDRCNHPSPSKRRPVFRTESNSSRPVETLTSQFFQISPNTPIDAPSRLNSSGTEDVWKGELLKSRPVPQYQPGVVTDSLWKEDKSSLYEQPHLVKQGGALSGSGSLLGSRESKSSLQTSPPGVVDSRRESLHAELLRRFRPSRLVVSESIKRRVQDGLRLLSAIRSAPSICSHTRQKLADYLNQSRRSERLPLRPIDDKRVADDEARGLQSEGGGAGLLRRQLPARPHRRVYSEWEYVSGEEFTSPVSDVDSVSDSDYSVDFEDLAASHTGVKSSDSVVHARERRPSAVQH